jgi:hypothetical protein
MNAVKASKDAFRAAIDRQHGAILAALDKLHEREVGAGAGKPVLRLVRPGEPIARDPVGEELRASIVRCGWDLWAEGGELELFGAMRGVMAARPSRQMWNRTTLSALWAGIGLLEGKTKG